MEEAQKNVELMDELDWFASKRDPVQKAFFGEKTPKTLRELTGQMVDRDNVKKRKKHKLRKLCKLIYESYRSSTFRN